MRRAVAVLLLAAVLLSVRPAAAAVPRLVLVYGPWLAQPVLLTDWAENGWALSGDELDPEAAALADRPYLELALFWGPQWDDYVQAGRPLGALRPEQANGHSRFYPAVGTLPALVEGVGSSLRVVSAEGLQVLRQHGVPVRLDGRAAPRLARSLPTTGGSATNPALLALGAALTVTGGLVRSGLRRRRR